MDNNISADELNSLYQMIINNQMGPASANEQELRKNLDNYNANTTRQDAVINGTPISTMVPNSVTTPSPANINGQDYMYTSDRGFYKAPQATQQSQVMQSNTQARPTLEQVVPPPTTMSNAPPYAQPYMGLHNEPYQQAPAPVTSSTYAPSTVSSAMGKSIANRTPASQQRGIIHPDAVNLWNLIRKGFGAKVDQ